MDLMTGAVLLIIFIVVIVFLFPSGASLTGGAMRSKGTKSFDDVADAARNTRSSIAERNKEEYDPDTKTRRKIEVAQRLDEIGAQPGGLMRFDKNGDGVLESQELAIARREIGLEIAAERGELPENESIVKPIETGAVPVRAADNSTDLEVEVELAIDESEKIEW